MSLEIFDSLFGTKTRARLIRFFTLNPEGEFAWPDIPLRMLLDRPAVTAELNRLERLKFVSCHIRRGKKLYSANRDFPFFNELHGLVAKLNVNAQSQVFKRLKLIGEVKMILVSGVFLNYPKAKADLILVESSQSDEIEAGIGSSGGRGRQGCPVCPHDHGRASVSIGYVRPFFDRISRRSV